MKVSMDEDNRVWVVSLERFQTLDVHLANDVLCSRKRRAHTPVNIYEKRCPIGGCFVILRCRLLCFLLKIG